MQCLMGENTIEQLTVLSRHLGYSGITLANHSDKLPQSRPELPSTNEFEVFRGIELVEENPSKLHGLIGKFRKLVDVPDSAWRIRDHQQGCTGKS